MYPLENFPKTINVPPGISVPPKMGIISQVILHKRFYFTKAILTELVTDQETKVFTLNKDPSDFIPKSH